jgi:hypothetical protein
LGAGVEVAEAEMGLTSHLALAGVVVGGEDLVDGPFVADGHAVAELAREKHADLLAREW